MVLVMEDVNLDLQVSTGSSALALSWNDVTATTYTVMCTSSEEANSSGLVYSSSHSICLQAVYNSTSTVLDRLIPGASYNCCVSAVGLPANRDCVTSVVQEGGGLATPVVGLIGGIIGALTALLVVLAIGSIIMATVICKKHRNRAHVSTHPLSRKPSQRYSRSTIPYPHSVKPPTVKDKHHGNPYVPSLHRDAELEDMGHVYDTTLTASQHFKSCPNLPGLKGGDNRSLQDTEEYEVMLTTGANPAYKNVQHPATTTADTQDVPLAGIYEQLP